MSPSSLSQRLNQHLQVLQRNLDALIDSLEQQGELPPDRLQQMAEQVMALSMSNWGEAQFATLQDLLCDIFTFHHGLAPGVPRELLWLASGSCLHYLSDEELEQFQQQEDELDARGHTLH